MNYVPSNTMVIEFNNKPFLIFLATNL